MSRSIPVLRSALAGVVTWVACGDPVAVPASRSPGLDEQEPEDRVWITTTRDSIELIERTLRTGVSPVQLETASGGEVAVLVPRTALAAIAEAQHEQRHRCAGFMLHDSESEAKESLRALAGAHQSTNKAVTYTLDRDATVQAILPVLREQNVLETIRTLSALRTRFHTSMTGQRAASWIRDTWQALADGREDATVELVDHQRTPQPSVKLTLRGASAPDEIVVLGGHLDSIAGRGSATALAPGADDNASGIATLTEIARAAFELGYRPARTVVFYAYAAEEVGLVGSGEIATNAKSAGLSVVGVMQLDMTNFTGARSPYIGVATDFTDQALNAFSVALIERYLDIPYRYFECGYACSDHASWTKNGFPATFPNEATIEEVNPQIHTANDTLALSRDSAAHAMHFARFGAAFMAELAKGDLPAPACAARNDCDAGQACADGSCGSGSSGDPSAVRDPSFGASPCRPGASCAESETGAHDAGKRDASTSASSPGVEQDQDEDQEEEDRDRDEDQPEAQEPTPAAREPGCGVSATGGDLGLWPLALAALLPGRRQRRRNAPERTGSGSP